MTFAQTVADKERRDERPEHAEDLLLYPIADDPDSSGAVCDGDWVKEHALDQRFYIGGLDWFTSITGYGAARIADYRYRAVSEARNSNWPAMKSNSTLLLRQLKSQWDAISIQQYFNVTASRAVNFPKASLFLISCEIALQDLLGQVDSHSSDDLGPAEFSDELLRISRDQSASGSLVYRHMAVVAACWNVNDFTEHYVQEQVSLRPDFLMKLSNHTRQSSIDLFLQLAKGHTVTYPTARDVKSYCENPDFASARVREVRVRSGRTGLGKLKAADKEEPLL